MMMTDINIAYDLIREANLDAYPIISTNPCGWEKIEISFDRIEPKFLRFIAKLASDFGFEIRRYEYGLKLIRELKICQKKN